MKRIIISAAIAAAAIGTGLGLVGSATAAVASSKVVVTTKSYAHEDTTSVTGTATLPDPQRGQVWAMDNLNETWTITPVTGLADGANYSVVLKTTGTFSGWADPRMASEGSPNPGGPLASKGKVTGTIQYDVSSSTAPDLSAVPAIQPANTSLSTVLGQIFDGNQSIVGGGHYTFTYANVAGAVYQQVG